MGFLENLPANCPIEKAKSADIAAAYRIVSSMTPTIEDFYSNAKLAIKCSPVTDPCRHASCSLFELRSKALDIAYKLPKTRIADPHLSLCSIKSSHGMTYVNKKRHVDFWPFDTFQPSMIVVKTERCDGD